MVSMVERIPTTVGQRGIALMVTRTHTNSGAFSQILDLAYTCTAGPLVYYSSTVHIHPTMNPRPKDHSNNITVKGMYSHSSNKIRSNFSIICSFLYTCTAGPVILLVMYTVLASFRKFRSHMCIVYMYLKRNKKAHTQVGALVLCNKTLICVLTCICL